VPVLPVGNLTRGLQFWRPDHTACKLVDMTGVTQILASMEQGDPHAADQLLPLVYDELRKLAAARMAAESPGHMLQATALVHEAWLRLVDAERQQHWDSRGHFFAAAAEAMRRILVDSARRRRSEKRGGGRLRESLDEAVLVAPEVPDDLLALDEALSRLEAADPRAAELVKLRYFAGLTIPEAAQALQVSPRTADDIWAYARAWLYQELRGNND
jgi:RNA polymerase sigma factor (TIGR02999 family)